MINSSRKKDVLIVKSAIQQTAHKIRDMILRIDGAHVEALPDNKITERNKTFIRATVGKNGGITVITPSNGSKYAISDKSTKRIFSQPELIPIWEIRAGTHFDIPFSVDEPFRFFRRYSNIHPSKHNWHTKLFDYWNASNDTWREMEKPRDIRGLDFQHPELW